VPHKKLFDIVNELALNLSDHNEVHALEIYGYFEFLLLSELGFGFNLDTCCICKEREVIKYISPKTCNGASFKCASRYDTKSLFEVPNYWEKWNGLQNYTSSDRDDIKQSLDITGYFISKNIIHLNNYFRCRIMDALSNKDLVLGCM
jgi:DNA repair protein RecO (recombination protein O)